MLTSSRFIDNAQLKQEVNNEPVNKILQDGKGNGWYLQDYRGVLVMESQNT